MVIEAKLNSSAIRAIRYTEESQILSVTFQSGGTYDYPAVPRDKVTGLLSAESAGKYFHKEIKQYAV
jgi:hypothetical protein